MLSKPEQRVLRIFRDFLVTPGEMICFSGTNLDQDEAVLERMSGNGLLVKEQAKGAYSLTQKGFAAMKGCE